MMKKILSKLTEKGNPLERLDAVMDWQLFLPLLSELFSRKNKVIGRGGRPHLDYLMMFKVLLLQRLHNLSDDAMEYQFSLIAYPFVVSLVATKIMSQIQNYLALSRSFDSIRSRKGIIRLVLYSTLGRRFDCPHRSNS